MRPKKSGSVPAGLGWFKSSYSSGNGGDCVEVAEARDAVLVRDSKRPEVAVVAVSGDGWNAFVEMVAGR